MKNDILDALFDLAKNSEPVFRVRIFAAIIDNNKIETIARNSKKTHPLAAKFSRHPDAIHLHAELNAIVSADKNVEGKDLYVVRAKNDKNEMILGNSFPCEGCMKALVAFKIRNVYYSTDDDYEVISITK